MDKNTEFGNGTTATAYVKQSATPLLPNANATLQETRARGLQNPITVDNINELAAEGYGAIYEHMVHCALCYILESSHFASYSHLNSPCFAPPLALYTLQ
jgi:hypothetical protein